MNSALHRTRGSAASPAYTLLRALCPYWLAFTLLLISFDVFLKTDTPVILASLALLAGALTIRASWLLPCALLLFFLYVAAPAYPIWVWRVPTAAFFVPLLLTGILCAPFAKLRAELAWLRPGKIDQIVAALVVITSLVSALALILWALWTDYLGVASHMLAPLRAAPRWFTLPILVPAFALANAAAEELVFRGVVQDALEKGLPERIWAGIFIQASAFAAVHYQSGFPNGKLGYAMTFVYAIMLGWLRRRSGGMLAPYIAHVAADLVIGATLVLLGS